MRKKKSVFVRGFIFLGGRLFLFENLSFELLLFGILKIWILNLFRISDFVLFLE